MALRSLLLLLALLSAASAVETRPNFIFIYTDDQRWDAMSVVQAEHGERGRYPWFKTPHMDRIAAEGVRFRNAFVTLALCAPSRAAFLTGRYNHLNGVVDNYTPFPTDSVTHASLLRAAGYTTAYIGKWHMGTQAGQRPGFSYSASYVGQGKYVDCPFEIDGVATPTQGWIDDVATDYALAFIQRQPRDKPFSVVLGFKSPHVPLEPPARAKERFTGEKWRLVPSMHHRAVYREAPSAKAAPNAERPTPLNYFRCISAVDDNVGRVLALLDELDLADNTVVVYSSDNGYLHGEHSLGDKRCAYDESIRIPLLMRFPKRFPKGTVINEMVLNLDLAPTYLELAGVDIPKEMQGRSVVPLTRATPSGERPEWRKAFFYEYFLEKQYPQTPTVFAVRTDTAKLVQYPDREDWTELFDLKTDPYETRNLARDPAYAKLRGEMEKIFAHERDAVAFRTPDGAGVR